MNVSVMDVEIIPIAELHEDPANVRRHPERNLASIRASLARFGQQKPIVIDANNVVRAGNGILASARALGWTELRCVRTGLAGVEATLYAIADNQIGLTSEWANSLGTVLTAIKDDIKFDPIEIGFLPAEFDALADALSENGNGAPVGDDGDDEDDDEEEIPSLEARFGPLPPPAELKAPFPYFGGKSRIAPLVWKRFGSVANYIEPFAGSLAVLLARPTPFDGTETVNDIDAMISNFWRSLRWAPEETAEHADWPSVENDLHARHAWLTGRKESLRDRLEGDPDFFDAKAAGWWVWGISLWIGRGFCTGDGPWVIEGGRLVNGGTDVPGVQRCLLHLSTGQGVNRNLQHLGDVGWGVARSSLGSVCADRAAAIRDYIGRLADRLRLVRVCCGEWTRICGGRDGDALSALTNYGDGSCGVFLDPPYADTAGRDPNIYTNEDLKVAHAVRDWAVARGSDQRFRIALCGYEGEHEMPDSWECVQWKTRGGYSNQSGPDERENSKKERVWFSPYCLR